MALAPSASGKSAPPAASRELPPEPSINDIEVGIARIVDAASDCFSRHTTSAEGVHLTACRENRRTWHEYWYLGSDVEPTCTESEMK